MRDFLLRRARSPALFLLLAVLLFLAAFLLASTARSAGEVLKMKVAGHGTFPQVLSLFDIIYMKKHWVRADLLRLARDGDRLSFELELSAYRSRGTYEEEKHRTDRSDGHRQEPGGKDTR